MFLMLRLGAFWINVQYICSSDNLQGLVTKGKIELKGMEKALSILKGVLDYLDFKDVHIRS